MKIAFISSEAVPYCKTGGLADVAGALPKALEQLGCEVKIFIPKYSVIDEAKFGLKYNWDVGEIPIRVAGTPRSVHLHHAVFPQTNIEVVFIDCPHYFFRSQIYTADHDEDERFILFCKAVIEAMQRLSWVPDIIHCNDWQTGLLPLLLKDNYSWDKLLTRTSTLFTIHNIAYQGRFPKATLDKAEIKKDFFFAGGPVEFFDDISFMKAGIYFSDLINTVSRKYAEEILTPEFGEGMEGVLNYRKHDLYGILNGVDYDAWDPAADKLIPYNYTAKDLSGKYRNKELLSEHFKLPCSIDVPLVGIVSRMVSQKGFDIFVEAVPQLMNLNTNWIVLGNGDDRYESTFRSLTKLFPDRFAAYIGFNTELSHLIEAGADIFLMPSRYEPCGLNQIYSLKYGTVPVVRKTGGLADTVMDWEENLHRGKNTGTGFSFVDYSGYALYTTVERAVNKFKYKTEWKKIQENGMAKEFSWKKSAKEYLNLYNIAIEKTI